MKLYTNRYDKNSLVAKTNPDKAVRKTPFSPYEYSIFNQTGQEVRVYTEKDVLNSQLHFKNGKPVEDSIVINTHFIEAKSRHYVFVNDVKVQVYTTLQINNINRKLSKSNDARTEYSNIVSFFPLIINTDGNTSTSFNNVTKTATGNNVTYPTIDDSNLDVLSIEPSLMSSLVNPFDSVETDPFAQPYLQEPSESPHDSTTFINVTNDAKIGDESSDVSYDISDMHDMDNIDDIEPSLKGYFEGIFDSVDTTAFDPSQTQSRDQYQPLNVSASSTNASYASTDDDISTGVMYVNNSNVIDDSLVRSIIANTNETKQPQQPSVKKFEPMKLYTNIYDKNSIIDKTVPDRSIKNEPHGRYSHYIFDDAGEEIRVYTENNVRYHQLHFSNGTPLENSDVIKTHFIHNNKHYVILNNAEVEVYTAAQLKNNTEKFQKKFKSILADKISNNYLNYYELMADASSNTLSSSANVPNAATGDAINTQSQEQRPAKKQKSTRQQCSSSSSTPQPQSSTTVYLPNVSIFHQGDAHVSQSQTQNQNSVKLNSHNAKLLQQWCNLVTKK